MVEAVNLLLEKTVVLVTGSNGMVGHSISQLVSLLQSSGPGLVFSH
jgi:hypothetical protein